MKGNILQNWQILQKGIQCFHNDNISECYILLSKLRTTSTEISAIRNSYLGRSLILLSDKTEKYGKGHLKRADELYMKLQYSAENMRKYRGEHMMSTTLLKMNIKMKSCQDSCN